MAGVIVAGLKTTALPVTSAGAIFHTGIATGKFHGVTTATTPKGCLIVYAKFKGSSEGIVSPVRRLDSPAQNSATFMERCNSPRDSAMVFPSSRVSICASSSLCSSIRRAALPTIRPRVGAGVDRHARKASAAASTAARASSRVARGVSPIMSSVLPGLIF